MHVVTLLQDFLLILSIPFYVYTTFPPPPCISQWTLNLFPILATVNSATINMEVQIPLQDPVSVLLDEYPEVGLLDHMVLLLLVF